MRTRIAPSPTGFLHLGTARTALYSWAFARHHGGKFILRIEDTDVARSTQDSVSQIIDAMHWLGLDYDEGPVFQMDRLDRYREVAERMLREGTAYLCYATPQELEAMRESQRERGEKTHYDGRWRPEPGKVLPGVPEGVKPVIRLRNPVDGAVTWDDLVKGSIRIANQEIDDLVIVRADGVPTYNFSVVVDDWDMAITHVFRGDEHVNNTPWQINIYAALGAPLPAFGHVPIILGDDGQKLSKRRGAVSVTAYRDAGYLPEAMLNYLARLGWSHGDEELFTRAQFVEWFDGSHLSKSPAQWDAVKLNWVNAQTIKHTADDVLAELVAEQLARRGVHVSANVATGPTSSTTSAPKGASAPGGQAGPEFEASPSSVFVQDDRLPRMCALFKDRCATTGELADWLLMYFSALPATAASKATLAASEAALAASDATLAASEAAALARVPQEVFDTLAEQLLEGDWNRAGISAAIKETLAAKGLKMPQLAPAVRLRVCGRAQTPSLDAVLELFPRETVLARLRSAVEPVYNRSLA